jgi:hypothetical protein
VLLLGFTWQSGPDSRHLSSTHHLPAWPAVFVAFGVILFVSPRVRWCASWITWGFSWAIWVGAKAVAVVAVALAVLLLITITVLYLAAILGIVGLIAELVAHFAFSVTWHRLGTGRLHIFNFVAIPLAVAYLFFRFVGQEGTIAMIDGIRHDSGISPLSMYEKEEIRKSERESRTSLLGAWREVLKDFRLLH